MKATISILFIFLLSCFSKPDLDSSFQFLPDDIYIRNGVVSKYYTHQLKKGSSHPTTDIRYRKTTLVGDNKIKVEDYNAGYQKIYENNIRVEDNVWYNLDETTTYQDDRVSLKGNSNSYTIKDSIFCDWENAKARNTKFIHSSDLYYEIQDEQYLVLDTLYENRHSKFFKGNRNTIYLRDQDTIQQAYEWTKLYSKGLGMVNFTSESETWKFEWDLVELMTIHEFNQRSNHGEHRIGHIDTTQVLNVSKPFSICGDFDKIFDYYNDDKAGFLGGKGRLKSYLDSNLDQTLLENESGYLTFRFVINCNGDAGWFTTEEADLAFNKKEFSRNCKNHLFQLISKVEKWKNLSIKGEKYDAYTYLTFKLENGKIIETLP